MLRYTSFIKNTCYNQRVGLNDDELSLIFEIATVYARQYIDLQVDQIYVQAWSSWEKYQYVKKIFYEWMLCMCTSDFNDLLRMKHCNINQWLMYENCVDKFFELAQFTDMRQKRNV